MASTSHPPNEVAACEGISAAVLALESLAFRAARALGQLAALVRVMVVVLGPLQPRLLLNDRCLSALRGIRPWLEAAASCYDAAMRDISLRCTCGKLSGTAQRVESTEGLRVVCYCDDYRAYAHYLRRADVVLDQAGGTDIFQLTPAQLTLTRGAEHLACIRLTPKGLLRWYAACCSTPVANTLPWAKVAFAGIPQPFMDHAADGESRDEAVGPVVVRVQGRYACGPSAEAIHPRAPISSLGRMAGNLFRGWIRGRSRPSPFFDAVTGRPVVEPTMLTPERHEELRQYCGPSSQ